MKFFLVFPVGKVNTVVGRSREADLRTLWARAEGAAAEIWTGSLESLHFHCRSWYTHFNIELNILNILQGFCIQR